MVSPSLTGMRLLVAVALLLTAALAVSAQSSENTFPSSKTVYTIAGVDEDGPGSFEAMFHTTFVEYLNSVVGPRFDPPISFSLRTMNKADALIAISTGKVDFAFLDAIVASCSVAASFGTVSTILTMGQAYSGVNLINAGGAILVRSDRTDITTLADLEGKSIAATDANDLFSYQAQVNMFRRAGLEIQLMAEQLVYTRARSEVLWLLENGDVDVGFVKAGYLEDSIEEELFEPNVFRSLEPITNHIISGSKLFPYQVSTLLYPDAPIIMHSSVDYNVQALVTSALLDINSTSSMAHRGRYAGWRPAANYGEVLNALQTAGLYDAKTEQCSQSVDLRDSIVCPAQYKAKSEADLVSSCRAAGIPCPAPSTSDLNYDCVCTACRAACGEDEIETAPGTCECEGGFTRVGGRCLPIYAFAIMIVVPAIIGLFFMIRLLLKWQQRRSDQIWYIKPHELEFDDPAVCLGSGSFGVVIQAEYRGSVVALKSILQRGQNLETALSKITTTRTRFGGLIKQQQRQSGTITKGKSTNRGLIASGFDYVEDDRKRGLCKLKRALAQANSVVQLKRHAKINGSVAGDVLTSRALAPNSVVPGSRRTDNARSGPARTLSTMFKSKAQREREQFIEEMRLLSKLRHPCVATVIGAVVEPNCPPILVMEHMDLGSLHSILHSPNMEVDDETMRMMMLDIVHGCRFLHAFEPPVVHGDLKSMNVLVDSRFRAKVADFGLSQRKACAGTPYFMAPELLRGARNSVASDVYAFGVVIYEMATKLDPFEGEDYHDVIQGVVKEKRRPELPRGIPAELAMIMRECWHWDPRRRPTFLELERRMAHFDSLHSAERNMRRNHGNNLVLDQVFPAHVAKALAAGQKLAPEHYDSVTIFFSDIVGFTDISKTIAPEKVCDLLDRLYTRFDILTENYDIFKVETIGDAYMAVTNLHKPQKKHADKIARFALDAITAAAATLIDESDPQLGTIKLRVGFHSGPVVANVVGTKNPRYCLFGDTVNTASRMESSSEAMRVHLSGASHTQLVDEKSTLVTTSRGVTDIKGKGPMETFWLDDASSNDRKNGGMTEETLQNEVERRRSSRLVRFDEPDLRSLTPDMQPVASKRSSLCVPPMNPAASKASLSKMQSAHTSSMVVDMMAKPEHSMAVVTEEKTLALDDVVVV